MSAISNTTLTPTPVRPPSTLVGVVMNRIRWSRIAVVAIMSAGALPFTQGAASADDGPVAGQDGTAESVQQFDLSCGAFGNASASPSTVGWDGPIDFFGNPMTIRTTYPEVVRSGEEFSYSLNFDPLQYDRGAFGAKSKIASLERVKLDINIPKGTEFVSAEVENVPDDSVPDDSSGIIGGIIGAVRSRILGYPTDIIRIRDDGNESSTGTHLRMALNNATERRTKDGVVTKDGPNAAGDKMGGWTALKDLDDDGNGLMSFPTINVRVKALGTEGDTITPTVRASGVASKFDHANNFLTFVEHTNIDNVWMPNAFHSLRCSPRNTSDSDVNNGAGPLATIKVTDSGVSRP